MFEAEHGAESLLFWTNCRTVTVFLCFPVVYMLIHSDADISVELGHRVWTPLPDDDSSLELSLYRSWIQAKLNVMKSDVSAAGGRCSSETHSKPEINP